MKEYEGIQVQIVKGASLPSYDVLKEISLRGPPIFRTG
jgi:hypothetical protein